MLLQNGGVGHAALGHAAEVDGLPAAVVRGGGGLGHFIVMRLRGREEGHECKT